MLLLTCMFFISFMSGCRKAALPSEEAKDAERGEECGLKPAAMLVLSLTVALTS